MSFIDLSSPTAGTLGDSILGAKASADDGDWLDAGLHTFVLGADVAGAVVDPLGSVARMGAEWLLEHVQPLRSLLDGLAGNSVAVYACAAQVSSAASRLRASSHTPCRTGAAEWMGQAATAHERARREVAAAEASAGEALDACGRHLERAAVVVGLVRDYVRLLLAEVIAAAVKAAAASTVTAGVLAPVMLADTAAQVSIAVAKAARRVKELMDSLARLESMIGTWAASAVLVTQGLRRGARSVPSVRMPDIRSALRQMSGTTPGRTSDFISPLMSAVASAPDARDSGAG